MSGHRARHPAQVCQHDPCWCGLRGNWSQEAHDRFLEERRADRARRAEGAKLTSSSPKRKQARAT